MNIAQSLFLRMNRKRFEKNFKPLGIKKKVNFLVSPPATVVEFLDWLPMLGELHALGHVILLAPRPLETILKITKPKLFEVMFYDRKPIVLTREFDQIKASLAGRTFACLIELDRPANLSLSFLVDAERRITFFSDGCYPYYNILFKDGTQGFTSFFPVKTAPPFDYLKLPALETKKLAKSLDPQRPLLFVNGTAPSSWNGGSVAPDRKTTPMIDMYKLLYVSDAYAGAEDELACLARIFNKPVVKP